MHKKIYLKKIVIHIFLFWFIFLSLALQLIFLRYSNGQSTSKFNDFYDTSSIIIVYGTSDIKAEKIISMDFIERIRNYYTNFTKVKFYLKADTEITSEERSQYNLMILGTFRSNELIKELSDYLPVSFTNKGFLFGGKEYDDPSNGISFIFPSKYNKNNLMAIYTGRTPEGVINTFRVPTGRTDYVIVEGKKAIREGYFKYISPDLWVFESSRDNDFQLLNERFYNSLSKFTTEHFIFKFDDNKISKSSIVNLSLSQERIYQDIFQMLQVNQFKNLTFIYYLYNNNQQKGRCTGDFGNGHVKISKREIHIVYNDEIQANGYHELTHLIANETIGECEISLLGEGLAVYTGDNHQGKKLKILKEKLLKEKGKWPSLQNLLNNYSFRNIPENLSYPLAGLFVKFLVKNYGITKFKQLYLSSPSSFSKNCGNMLEISSIQIIQNLWHKYLVSE